MADNHPLADREVIDFTDLGISPSRFALAWRADDRRPLVREYVRACELAAEATD